MMEEGLNANRNNNPLMKSEHKSPDQVHQLHLQLFFSFRRQKALPMKYF